MNSRWQLFGLTLLVCLLYYGLSALPDSECGLLHYEVTERTAEGFEFCRGNVSVFMNLDKLQFPTELRLSQDRPFKAEQEEICSLRFLTQGKKALRPHEIAISHTEKIHLLVIDESLEDYQHIHPRAEGMSDTWFFEFTPRREGRYMFFAELVLLKTMRQLIARTLLDLGGEVKPYTPIFEKTLRQGDYLFELDMLPRPAGIGDSLCVQLKINRVDGGVVKLQPMMGAHAHVVAFESKLRGFAHMHPIPTGKENDSYQPELEFAFKTLDAGNYRFWVQLKIEGQDYAVAFDREIQAV